MTTKVRIRGMHATAATIRCEEAGFAVVDPSPTVADRIDAPFPAAPPDVVVRDAPDRGGLEVSGRPSATAEVLATLGSISLDTLTWMDDLPDGAVRDGEIVEERGGGAIVRTDDGDGYLPFDAVDAYVEVGDRLEVQVVAPEPPWTRGRHARLGTETRIPGTYVSLVRDEAGGVSAPDGALARTIERLDPDVPDGWAVLGHRRASEVSPTVLREELTARCRIAEHGDDPARATGWCRIGREGRFQFDAVREAEVPTVGGHHRMKAIGDAAGSAVDLIEAHAPNAFPFDPDAVFDAFGPGVGERIRIDHGKPDGRTISLGRGEVIARDDEGSVTIERHLSGGGRYDALGVPKEDGDRAKTTFVEGRWWYPTVYRAADGTHKGTYVNVGTPLEIFPDRVRYVDLHVDVIKSADGTVAVVDRDELAAARDAGRVPAALEERAVGVATSIANGL